MLSRVFALTLLATLGIFGFAYGLDCYQCQYTGASNETNSCRDFNETAYNATKCTNSEDKEDDYACFVLEEERNNTVLFYRGCLNVTAYSGDPCKNASNLVGNDTTVNRCDTCSKDGCNSGSQFSVSTLLFAIVFMFPLLNSLRKN